MGFLGIFGGADRRTTKNRKSESGALAEELARQRGISIDKAEEQLREERSGDKFGRKWR